MLDYANVLNQAQYDAVTCDNKSVLVVAGAGSGKTRVIVYRLAWLLEHGVDPASILLLTFTRKAAREMMQRAGFLLEQQVEGITGGTFHSFAFGALRRFRPDWLEGRSFSLMDAADITEGIRLCRERAKVGQRDSSFPKTQTIAALVSKARNKEKDIGSILRRESFHLLPYAEALEDIARRYVEYKREQGLLDYDDLLFELEGLLAQNGYAAQCLRQKFGHILVDEYQDTNLAQARIVRLLANHEQADGQTGAHVMAVGDEAQSIYAFRGANVRNILDFPKFFPDMRLIRLEENYRSTQPILDVANDILRHAAESFRNELFTAKDGGNLPKLVFPLSDSTEANLIANRIEQLLESRKAGEIAVLFRSGFHSFFLENVLRQRGIAFNKYGGLRFVEAAHIKDALSFVRISINPLDYPAFSRIASMHKGIGPKTSQKLYVAAQSGNSATMANAFKKYPEFREDLDLVAKLREEQPDPAGFLEKLLQHYQPKMQVLYPDDWPTRARELEALANLASTYNDLELFVADVALDSTAEEDASAEDRVVLSTIHSAKGLEWDAVLLLDLVEDRFPSRHAQANPEDFEEERRLFYVGCTRAREVLEIYAPATLRARGGFGNEPVTQSPFIREISADLFQKLHEGYDGGLKKLGPANRDLPPPKKTVVPSAIANMEKPGTDYQLAQSNKKDAALANLASGYCRHRIFGRGKIVEWVDDAKVRVDFPRYGVKTILAEYLLAEE